MREGASTLTSLLSVTGKPHLHCRSILDWDINIDLAKENLMERLIEINDLICKENYANNLDFSAWNIHSIDKMIGEYIIDSYQKDSDLSNFFIQLKQHANDPSNDRILIDLMKVVELYKEQKKKNHLVIQEEPQTDLHDLKNSFNTKNSKNSISLIHYIGQNTKNVANLCYRYAIQVQNLISKTTSTYLVNNKTDHIEMCTLEDKNKSTAEILQQLSGDKCSLQNNPSITNKVFKKAQEYALSVVKECPSYFPENHPYFWQKQGNQLFAGNEILSGIPCNATLLIEATNSFLLGN